MQIFTHAIVCLPSVYFTVFHPMELSKKECWEGHRRNEVVTVESA